MLTLPFSQIRRRKVFFGAHIKQRLKRTFVRGGGGLVPHPSCGRQTPAKSISAKPGDLFFSTIQGAGSSARNYFFHLLYRFVGTQMPEVRGRHAKSISAKLGDLFFRKSKEREALLETTFSICSRDLLEHKCLKLEEDMQRAFPRS